ncbi:hypothetical protein ACSBM8_16465 [Sphingomonas sp. ASY06-1R]|jgi:hypothetical protein|uniref:hypothetical protein n=1 Tax=Sphingomonas sp. ASY06-1R TaxID=3445771 RepID=UPI003FA2887B
MRNYRLYLLDASERIIKSEVVTVATDDEAGAEAARLGHPNPIEIWEGARKVALIRPGPSA